MLKKILFSILWIISIFWVFGFNYSLAQDSWVSSISSIDSHADKPFSERLRFFAVLVPAAIADSINPCEFAILLILLSSILTKHKSYKKMYLAGFLFTIAIFISYFAMWVWLYRALAFAQWTYYLKLIVWLLWIWIWLFNIKDFFWYGKWFVMEVPYSWRPKMHKLVEKIVSPWWAFLVWFLISLFLLPCTSGPYLTILWYLASESSSLNIWWYIYLWIYNIIFIVPMIIITIIIWTWYKTIEELAKIRKQNIRLIHLVIWILMFWLWIYVLNDLFSFVKF